MLYDDKLHEECGVFGVYTNDDSDVAFMSYLALYALQHRGQESAGISVSNGKSIETEKGVGLVGDVFSDQKLLTKMKGHIAVGHVRYSTAGGTGLINAQPIYGKFKQGEMAVAHNGTLVNVDVLKEMFEDLGYTFETSSDSEIIIKLIARAAKKGILRAIDDTVQAIKGSYSLAMIVNDQLIGVRDPQGIRPLCLGKLENGYVLSSESCAFDNIGAEFIRDVKPGEIVIINKEGIKSINTNERTFCQTCAFEYVYFARPDSIMDGISVHESRKRAGKILFEECPVDADVVIGVPDSGLDAALGFANQSKIPYDIGLIKNKYMGRSFIIPDQKAREMAVKMKLNAVKSVVKNKRVVMIDDSVVRGTTSTKIIQLLREAGAKEVHMRISSPVVAYPCYFGIDTPYRSQLMGANLSVQEMCDQMGADSLGFLSIEGLLKSLGKGDSFCLGCLNGKYPISVHIEEDL